MYNFQGHLFSKQILVSIGQAKTYILYIYEYSIYLVISYSLLYNGVFWGLLWIITQNENVQKIYERFMNQKTDSMRYASVS